MGLILPVTGKGDEKTPGAVTDRGGLTTWLCHREAGGTRTSHFISLSLGFLNCKTGRTFYAV